MPLGRDQPDNAARVVHAGAGIRLRKNASIGALRTAVSRVIEDPRYRAAARQMAVRLASERDDNRAIDELEQVAAGVPATDNSTRPASGEMVHEATEHCERNSDRVSGGAQRATSQDGPLAVQTR